MIEIKNLNFGYGKKQLFNNLNLSLQPGHIYGLLGKNGAGKSTLLKNISGLVFPSSGNCLVNGFTAAKRLPAFLQDIFFVPEDIYLPSVNARQFEISTGLFYPRFDSEEYYRILSGFDVPEDVWINKLSYGQQKKVMIAFGIAANTSILIMDEPTNGLDIPSKSQFRKVIASALTDERCILISTHQVRDLDNLIDTVLILDNCTIPVAMSLDDIAQRVTFGIVNRDNTGYIYGEETFEGVRAITKNTNGNNSRIDMELLFNAVISKNNVLTDLLKQ